MFENMPDGLWFVSLANLTKWFHWPAWSALLSFAALMKTIEISNRAENERKRRESAYVKSILFSVGTAAGVVSSIIDFLKENKKTYKEFLLYAADGPSIPSISKTLDSLKVSDMPATEAIDIFVTASSVISGLSDKIRRLESGSFEAAEAALINDRDKLARWATSLADLSVRLGGRPESHDDGVVQSYMRRALNPISHPVRFVRSQLVRRRRSAKS
ncbi:MAG: hypothetical protein V4707_08170 [Pseudomonadota bacterium]